MVISTPTHAQLTGGDPGLGDTCSPLETSVLTANPGGNGGYIMTCMDDGYGGGQTDGAWTAQVLAEDPTVAQQIATRSYTDNLIPGAGCNPGGPSDCPNIGDQCNDNTIFAGWHPTEKVPLFIQPTDAASSVMYSSQTVYTSAQNYIDGSFNQSWIEANKVLTDYPAFNECKLENDAASQGHTDWYLPSRIEMAKLRWHRDTINAGPSTAFASSAYWSSTESTNDNTKAAYQAFNTLSNVRMAKSSTSPVRCMRRNNGPIGNGMICQRMGPSDCPAIADICDDGSIFIGYHPSIHEPLFLHPEERGSSLAWSTESVSTSATDILDGQANQSWIEANKTLSDYPAFEACNTLNGTPADNLGYTDWYLPSSSELFLMWPNRSAITASMTSGNLSSLNHSSTEYNSGNAMVHDWTGMFAISKSNTYRVTCIRRGI